MMFSSHGACRSADELGLNLPQTPGRATPPLEGDGVLRDPHISCQWDLPQAEALKLQLCRCADVLRKHLQRLPTPEGKSNTRFPTPEGARVALWASLKTFTPKIEINGAKTTWTNGGCQLEGLLPVGGKNSRFNSSSLKRQNEGFFDKGNTFPTFCCQVSGESV